VLKIIFTFCFTVLFSISAIGANLTITNAKVTAIKIYETTDDSLNIWIMLDGNSRVGPNPDNPSVTCELWSHDKAIHSTALAALMAGKNVTVRYVDRGDKSYWCNVKDLTIMAN